MNILAGRELIRKKWQEVQVGDIIQVENNEFIPVRHYKKQTNKKICVFQADMILLSTSKPNGLCFIETAELDGEINLKLRRALHETCSLKDHIDRLVSFNGKISKIIIFSDGFEFVFR